MIYLHAIINQKNSKPMRKNLIVLIVCICIASTGCNNSDSGSTESLTWNTVQDSTQRKATIEGGLKGPEAVQYDAKQDVYFISNFNGDGNAADSNGFIARAQTDGTIDSLKFMTGTEEFPFHSGRGMFIVGDTLFVCDVNGVHGFDRQSGQHLSYADLSQFEPGFVNDIAMGPDSALYVTDTGNPRLYRISGNRVSIAVDSLPHVNNGIVYDEQNKRLVMAGWNGAQTFLTYNPVSQTIDSAGTGVGGNYDGIEFVESNFIVSSQADSSLQLIKNGTGAVFAKLPGRPADIGLDTQRNQIAVPFVALNRVDIWQLPESNE